MTMAELLEQIRGVLVRRPPRGSLSLDRPIREALLRELETASFDKEELPPLFELCEAIAFERRSQRPLAEPLIRLALDQGRSDCARSILDQICPSRPRRASLRLLLARLLYAEHRYEESLELAASFGPEAPEHLELLELRARNLLQLGRGVEAVKTLDRELPTPSEDSSVRELELMLLRERAARESGRSRDLARPALLESLLEWTRRRGESSLHAQAAWALGLDASQRGQDDAALRYLERAREAWLQLGDRYRCAEIQNSEAILLHKLGRAQLALATFEEAHDHLTQLGEGSDVQQAQRIVALNRADLLMDLEHFERAAEELATLGPRFGRGFLQLKCELMRLEALARLGAAWDLVSDELDKLRADIAALQRSALQAYYHRLRFWLARGSGELQSARHELARESECHERSGDRAAWAEAQARLAALQSSRKERRATIAGALWRSRPSPPPLLRLAHDLLRSGPSHEAAETLPLERSRRAELIADFAANARSTRPAPTPQIESALWIRLCTLSARGEGALAPGELAELLIDELGAQSFVLWARSGGLSWSELRVHGDVNPAQLLTLLLEIPPERRGTTRCVSAPELASIGFYSDDNDSIRLALVHREIPLRFGARVQVLARALCEGLAAHSGREPAPPSHAATLPRRELPHSAGLVGNSQPMQKLRAELERFSRAGLPIVLTGETGVGKSRAAHFVHQRGPRALSQLLTVHGEELSETLGQSELFGHAAGAFTGAEHARPGLLEQASGGILLLEGVEQIDKRLQALLARALDRRRIRRLGESIERRIDVQILATCSKSLDEAVHAGELLPELRFALGAAELRLLPLRERLEDLDPLVRDMLREVSGPRLVLPRSALRALACEAWPGNVRELSTRVRRALALIARPEDFADALLQRTASAEPKGPSLEEALREYESELLRRTLAAHGGHRGAAAAQLGISRRWLSEKLARHGIAGR
jgi:DNA-binding NtrC family response regulator/tetratricopeptide (TPR) repeat protein